MRTDDKTASQNDFGLDLDLNKLKPVSKFDSNQNVDETLADNVAIANGYVARDNSPKKRGRGRPKSPFTEQLHTRIPNDVLNFIIKESQNRGVQYGAVVTEAIRFYKASKK